MKILEKIKKGLMGIGTFLLILPTRILAQYYENYKEALIPQPAYGVVDYKTQQRELFESIWNVCKVLIIPIIFMIGIIVYVKKSKSSKIRKTITIIITLIMVVILYMVINNIIENNL